MSASSLLWKQAQADGFCNRHKWPHFSSFRPRNGESLQGLEPPHERKIRYLQHFWKKAKPTLIQAKHGLSCMRRNSKSLQEIAHGFQVFRLFIFTDSGFLQGKKMSFLTVPDPRLCSCKHWFREVLCCYLFSTNGWTGTALKKEYPKSPVSAGIPVPYP